MCTLLHRLPFLAPFRSQTQWNSGPATHALQWKYCTLKTSLPLEDAGVGEAAVRARGEQGEALVLALQAVATRGDVEVGGGMMMGQRSERWVRDAPCVRAEGAGIRRRGGDEKGSAHLAVATSRAPVAPKGWPMASDPPSTLVLARSIWPTARPVGNRSCAN